MLAFTLAFRNLLGAGLRTWLNVAVLSFAFVMIIFYNGMLDGWNQQSRRDAIQWEYGQGQLWMESYDPMDPFSYQDAHQAIPANLAQTIAEKNAVPILIRQGSIFPQGRMFPVELRGIDPSQSILKIPVDTLLKHPAELTAVIGSGMAESAKLKAGDRVMVRWRDQAGTFDAAEILILDVFKAGSPAIDKGKVWMSLDQLQRMTGMEGQATYMSLGDEWEGPVPEGWIYKDHAFLLQDLDAIIQSKKGSGTIMYGFLLLIALLAIFDTQVLSVFRRQKEIGTYIALGMTRTQVVGLFTVEGGAHSILAAILGALYGTPLFLFLMYAGIPMPGYSQDIGIPIAEKIFPVYGFGLIVGTTLLVVLAATIVSYFPARKIAKMDPTAALKGRIQ